MSVEINGRTYRKDVRLRGILILLGPLNYTKTRNRHFRCEFCGGRVHRVNDRYDPLRCSKKECRTLQSMAEKPTEEYTGWSEHAWYGV